MFEKEKKMSFLYPLPLGAVHISLPHLVGGYQKLSQNGKTKGQLILKCLFCVFNFLQKTNKKKSHSSKIEFVHSIFGGNVGLKK